MSLWSDCRVRFSVDDAFERQKKDGTCRLVTFRDDVLLLTFSNIICVLKTLLRVGVV